MMNKMNLMKITRSNRQEAAIIVAKTHNKIEEVKMIGTKQNGNSAIIFKA